LQEEKMEDEVNREKYLEKLTKQMNVREIPKTLRTKICSLGVESYNYLLANLDNSGRLTDYQIINTFIILRDPNFLEFFLENPLGYYGKLMEFATSDRIKVRSRAAVILLISFYQVQQSPFLMPYLPREIVNSVLQKSLSMKLNRSAEDYVKAFINKNSKFNNPNQND
jgi:hypothetical protein